MKPKCIDIDECQKYENPCEGKLHCTNTVGSFVCGCRYGYETVVISDWKALKTIPTCVDIDECSMSGVCPENSNCQNTAGNYTCQCDTGFQGNLCQDINECLLASSCDVNAICSNTDGSYNCDCRKGFYGDGKTCKEGQCDNRDCPSGRKCVSPTSDKCECKEGLTPQKNSDFCLDIDECLLDHECHANSTCHNVEASYTCICDSGFFGSGLICEKGQCNEEMCSLNEECVSPRKLECRCKNGYDRNQNGLCVDVDECSSRNDTCDENADCTNTDGGYTCECHEGFFGSGSPCFIGSCSPLNCPKNQRCVSPRAIDCTCAEGFVYNDELDCVDTDECARGTHNCSYNANCLSTEGSYTCNCNFGFFGDGKTCNEGNCTEDMCNFNEECVSPRLDCQCIGGFERNETGTCVDIDECSASAHGCSKNSTCSNTDGSYMCSCQEGYENGTFCYEYDECTAYTHNCRPGATCTNTEGSFTCDCEFLQQKLCRSNWILVIRTNYLKLAYMIDGKGKSSDLKSRFTIEEKTNVGPISAGEMDASCSIIWRGKMFVFGGSGQRRRISAVESCQLKKKGTLNFDLETSACAQRDNYEVIICFASPDRMKICLQAGGPLQPFKKFTKSNYGHLDIRIAVTSSKLSFVL